MTNTAPGGLFITLEGIEGVGKSSAVSLVVETMQGLGYSVESTREPGGTELGEDIRGLLLRTDRDGMSSTAELLLMFAARAQHLHERIEPALRLGHCVVCDRFTDATYAYQGGGRGLDMALINAAERMVHPDRKPDLTLLLDAPIEIALARARSRGSSDRFERENVEFFTRVQASYRQRARAEPQRIRLIDTAVPLDAVHRAIVDLLEERYR